jgi:hypothetical protein
MAIIKLPDHNLSNSAARRSKHWMKILTRVNTAASNGYAFEGQFANFEATIEVGEGTWVMSYIEDVRGSGYMDGRDVTLYQVRDGALSEIESWRLDGKAGWALQCRDAIAAHLTAPKTDLDELRAERARLVARIAEIDALTAAGE